MDPMTAPRLPVAPVPAEPSYRTNTGRVVAMVYPAVTLDGSLLVDDDREPAPPTPPFPSDPGPESTWGDVDASLEPPPVRRLSAPVSPRRSGGPGRLVALAFAVGAVSAGAVMAAGLMFATAVAGGATAWALSQSDAADATFIIMPENRPGADAPADRVRD